VFSASVGCIPVRLRWQSWKRERAPTITTMSIQRLVLVSLVYSACRSFALPTLEEVVNDVNTEDEYHLRGVLKYAVEERDPQFLRDLLRALFDEKGADVRKAFAPEGSRMYTIPQYNILLYACMRETDEFEKVQILIDAGIDKDFATDNSGVGCVHLAGQYGNPKVMKVLLKKGADITPYSASSMNAATMAARQGKTEVLRVMKEFGGEALKTLTQRDTTQREDTQPPGKGYTPLEYGIVNGRIETMRFLIFEVGWGKVDTKEVIALADIAVKEGKYDATFVASLRQLVDKNSEHFKEQRDMHFNALKEAEAEKDTEKKDTKKKDTKKKDTKKKEEL